MKFPSFVLAYHGCDLQIQENILLGKAEVSISKNDYDWLGAGAYFGENNPQRALEWARFLKQRPQNQQHSIKEPACLGAVIDLGNCLDLTDSTSLSLIKSAYLEYKSVMERAKEPLPINESAHGKDLDLVKRYLDCAVINFFNDTRDEKSQFAEELESFDTVRGVFTEGGELYTGAKIMAKTHIQICVRNPAKSVVGYFLPKGIDNN